jgi:hypothetical protein
LTRRRRSVSWRSGRRRSAPRARSR